jgi:hypothetical protein
MLASCRLMSSWHCAMQDVKSLATTARRHGEAIRISAERLLDTDLLRTKMRQAYRLGLVRRYGFGPADTACQLALNLDVVDVTSIASMLEKAHRKGPGPPRPASAASVPFARDPGEYRTPARQLTLIDGRKGVAQ